MASIEERLQAIEREHMKLEQGHQVLEREHTDLKKTIELQTIAIGALVNKATLEKLNEKYDKLFDSLIAHDKFTNTQLAELRDQSTELDGKVVGVQTEMRQRFNEQDNNIIALDGKVVGLQTEMRQRFNGIAETTATKEDMQATENRILQATREDMQATENRILQAITRIQHPQPE